MRPLPAVTMLLLSCVLAQAQEPPDILGTWIVTVEGMAPHPQCGASVQTGVMDIERRITPRAYRARIRTEASYERCEGTGVSHSSATVRRKEGNLITIEYDEDGWEMDRLRLVDGIMTGDNGEGVTTRWVRDDAASVDAAAIEEQLQALESMFDVVRPIAVEELSKEYFELIWKALARAGDLAENEAKQVTGVMIERMTECMMDIVREFATNQISSAGGMLSSENAVLMFDPNAVEFIGTECVEDAASNAGIRLR